LAKPFTFSRLISASPGMSKDVDPAGLPATTPPNPFGPAGWKVRLEGDMRRHIVLNTQLHSGELRLKSEAKAPTFIDLRISRWLTAVLKSHKEAEVFRHLELDL
jgi:hypothetical protein